MLRDETDGVKRVSNVSEFTVTTNHVPPTIRNWQPNDMWYNAIRQSTSAWQDGKALPGLRELVREHAKTHTLLEARRNTPDLVTKQKLGRTIWRARRKAKRQRAQRELEDACRNKRCPQATRRSMHFNSSKTCGPHGDASQQLFDYYSGAGTKTTRKRGISQDEVHRREAKRSRDGNTAFAHLCRNLEENHQEVETWDRFL